MASRKAIKTLITALESIDQERREARAIDGSLEQDDALCYIITTLLAERPDALTPKQLFVLGVIAHHAPDGHQLANTLARRAWKRGYRRSGWLIAAIEDSQLIRRGCPQRYGTQYRWNRRHGGFVRVPLEKDSNRKEVDTARASLKLPPLDDA